MSNSVSETFDTFSQNNLMIEGVDWDFNGGQFIDNPVPTAPNSVATNSYFAGGYFVTNASVFNIDYNGTYDGVVFSWWIPEHGQWIHHCMRLALIFCARQIHD